MSKTYETPAAPGEVLMEGMEGKQLDVKNMMRYRSGVGKLLYLSKWSRPDLLNITRELSRFLTRATPAHEKAMMRTMAYCVSTVHRGIEIRPDGNWNGIDKEKVFETRGVSDSDFAKDQTTRRSVSGFAVFLNNGVISTKSKMQGSVSLLVTEAELMAATSCAQEMIYVKNLLEAMQLKVKTPMKLLLDNKGAIDLINNWSIGGRTRHIGVRINFMRELKESGIIEVDWVPTEQNCADMFTKNLPGKAFTRHAQLFCGSVDSDSNLIQWEGVTMGSRKMEDVDDESEEVPKVTQA